MFQANLRLAPPAKGQEGGAVGWRVVSTIGFLLLVGLCDAASGEELARLHRSSPLQASTSRETMRDAVRAIPLAQLEANARAKASSVLANVSVFRRLPVSVVGCDPDLHLFLVRHPDVVVNIWEVLKISRLQLREIAPKTFQMTETAGTLATMEFLYESPEMHIVYGEGTYDGPLFAKPVRGKCLIVLRTGYVREPNGRHYITNRLDTFLNIEHGGAELLTKTFHPLVGGVADRNFLQSVRFLGSLSRTAEVNSRGVQRLASRLEHVEPVLRARLAVLAEQIARQSPLSVSESEPAPADTPSAPPRVARSEP